MIIIVCRECHEAVSAHKGKRVYCPCQQSFAYFLGTHLYVSPSVIPLGIGNTSLIEAVANRPAEGWGWRVDALIIPHDGVNVDRQPTILEESDADTD